ncbi:MAG: RAD55 family ATPase [Thermoplasmata archaeon]
MSTAVRLPAELRAFLQLRGPQTLLVRGPPGSGKSTLCLALLESSPGEKILITSRVSTGELHREFPWLGANSGGIQVVDSSDVEPPFDPPDGTKEPTLLVDDPSPRERRELTEFLHLPSPVQDAWSRLPRDGPSVVVIDSWDALVEQYLGRRSTSSGRTIERSEIERILLRRMGHVPCHLVLVVEREDQTPLDYLVNGVIVTRREVNDDRLERWLSLPKLRGIRIANSAYPYTVDGAKFQCIDPIRAYGQLQPGEYEPEPDPLPNYLWPGSKSFVESFGRLPLGRLSIFEADDDLPDQMLGHLLRPAIRWTLHAGGRVLLVPSLARSAEEIWASVAGAADPALICQRMRVVDVSHQLATTTGQSHPEFLQAVVPPERLVPTLSDPDAKGAELTRWLKGPPSETHPGLVLLYETGLQSLAASMKISITPDVAANFLAGIQSTLGGANLHLFMIGRPGSELFNRILSVAAIRIRLRNRLGRVFLYGLKPWTSGFVLAEGSNGGPYELLRIV